MQIFRIKDNIFSLFILVRLLNVLKVVKVLKVVIRIGAYTSDSYIAINRSATRVLLSPISKMRWRPLVLP